jgi:tetraprenyl-beta-curcumene synthase
MATRVLDDWSLVVRAGVALLRANLRYWVSIAPTVRRELKLWRARAMAIEDPELRALALAKLHDEGFHAEGAAMLATLAPRAQRRSVAAAIVALELLFDYLDGLNERPSEDPLADGERMFEPLSGAFCLTSGSARETAEPSGQGGGYIESLSRSVAVELGRLPRAAAVCELAVHNAQQNAQAQIRMHAVPALGMEQLERWAQAKAESEHSGLDWREFLAGAASSVLVLHALIAAAADPATTPEQAGEIAGAYLSTCVLLTLLDGLVDHEQDTHVEGQCAPGYLAVFADHTELPELLGRSARRAASDAARLPDAPHHLMILVGVAAYYASEPGAGNPLAKPVLARLRGELSPLMAPTLAIIRAWREVRRHAHAFGAKVQRGSQHETP